MGYGSFFIPTRVSRRCPEHNYQQPDLNYSSEGGIEVHG